MGIFKKTVDFLYTPINASIVCLFRIIFGLFLTYQIGYYFGIDYTYQFISGPEVLFHYNELSFFKPLPLGLLKFLQVGLLVAAVGITLGIWYRYAMTYFFIVFTYFSFVDSTLFNNHIYLLSLLSFVMIFIRADTKYCLQIGKKNKENINTLPAWNQYILMFLIALPYFFGGIAKLSYNWLYTNLVSELLSGARDNYLVQLFSEDILIPFIKYGGLLYDLGIVFLLLFRRTRILGFCLILFFNLTNNSILFDDIGIFPFFMICASLLFFNPEKVGSFIDTIFKKKSVEQKLTPKERKRLRKERAKTVETSTIATSEEQATGLNKNQSYRGLVTAALLLFVLFHIIFPFRYHLYTDNPEWTGVASHFSWRMKMQSVQIVTLNFTMQDKATGATGEIGVNTFISQNQSMHIVDRPVNLVLLAKYLKPQIEKKYNIVDPKITADVTVKFNGLPAQQMIFSDVDLTEIDETNYNDLSWIVPLKAQQNK